MTNLRHDKGLTTCIGSPYRDGHGSIISGDKRQRIKRLRKWNKRFRTHSSDERNLRQALGEIERMASALGVPDTVRETAAIVYRRALEEELLPGRSIEGIATAALYIATRQAGCPRTISEIEPTSRVNRQTIARAYRYTARELSIHLSPEQPQQYLNRLTASLNCDTTIEQTARDLLKDARRTGLFSGKSRIGLAAGAIYTAAQIEDGDIVQKDVAAASNVTTVTVRSNYKDFLKLRDTE